jgi:AcrR family transcriptional regulator
MAAARDLFVQQGFDRTSTLQIARRAGVSEGILFHHFGSKRALFESVAQAFVQDSVTEAMPDLAELSEERVVRGAFDFADANPGMYRLLSDVGGRGSDPDYAGRAGIIVAAIRRRLEPAMAAGTVRAGDPEILAQLQLAVVDGAYQAWRRSGEPARREDYITLAAACLKAMLAPADQRSIEPHTGV